MNQPSHPKIYDQIGAGYLGNRIPDPRIGKMIRDAIGAARTVCNVGAGTGSYEPTDLEVTAVEPSTQMIQQRRSRNRVIQAVAESLPFADKQFDVAMTVLSMHHWEQPQKGVEEMQRVSARQVILTFDPDRVADLWLIRDYLPEIPKFESKRAIPIKVLQSWLGNCRIETVPVPYDCSDGFQAAYWRRPYEYLKPQIRNSISSIAQAPKEIVDHAMKRLEDDLESGLWLEKNGDLIDKKQMDYGYRLLVT